MLPLGQEHQHYFKAREEKIKPSVQAPLLDDSFHELREDRKKDEFFGITDDMLAKAFKQE